MQGEGKNEGFILQFSFTRNTPQQVLLQCVGFLKQHCWFWIVLFPLRLEMKAFLTFAFPLSCTLEMRAVIVIPFSNCTKKTMAKVSAMLSCLFHPRGSYESCLCKNRYFGFQFTTKTHKSETWTNCRWTNRRSRTKPSVDRQGSSGKSLLIATQEQSLSWYNWSLSRCLNKMFFFSCLNSEAKFNSSWPNCQGCFPSRSASSKAWQHMLKESYHSSQAVGFL